MAARGPERHREVHRDRPQQAAAMAALEPKPHEQHRASAPSSVGCAVVTVSDTRTIETDEGGRTLAQGLTRAGHAVRWRAIVRDEPVLIRAEIERALSAPDVDVVVLTGGTGISSRDSTYEVASALLEKRLDGFGELFRFLSFGEIGPAAMLSRALAGTARSRLLVALPGSPQACRLALERLLLPELGHIVGQLRK